MQKQKRCIFVRRERKEKIMTRMKVKKVSPRSKDQVVLGLSYLFTGVINLNEYTGLNKYW